MLDPVPFAGAGRQVADDDRQVGVFSQFLQFQLPQPHSRAVAAATVRGNQQAVALG